jgi:S-adenosylmethionine hydrolase
MAARGDIIGKIMRPFITLTTDFGLKDTYVASIKAVLWSNLPDAVILDITHEIPAFTAEFALPPLMNVIEQCPRGTFHLVVVDPGVGSHRRPLIALSSDFSILLPDNGLPSLLSRWIKGLRFIHLSDLPAGGGLASATFPGRDLFAPALVYLAQGKDPWTLGPEIPLDHLVKTRLPHKHSREKLPVWNIDRFGNILLGYRATHPPERVDLSIGERLIPYVTRYQRVRPGELGCLINSSGWLEIFCREGSAAKITLIEAGKWIRCRIFGGEGKFLA